MTEKTAASKEKSPFGLPRLMRLGGVLIGGILLGGLLTLHAGSSSIAGAIGSGTKSLAWFPILLWLVELALYGWLALRSGVRKPLPLLTLVVAGMCLRLLIVLVFALLFSRGIGQPVFAGLLAMHGSFWVFRVLAMAMTAAMFVLGLPKLQAEPARKPAATPARRQPVKKQPVKAQFSFNTARDMSKHSARPRAQSQGGQSGDDDDVFGPPEGFHPVVPAKNVEGVAMLPATVIYDSIPDAIDLLEESIPVRVRLSYLVPQMVNGTAWLTWQQVFPDEPESPNVRHIKAAKATELSEQWIRIPAKQYALQVPREHFTRISPGTLPWMKLAAVPQEDQLAIK